MEEKHSKFYLEILNNQEISFFCPSVNYSDLPDIKQNSTFDNKLEEIAKWLSSRKLETQVLFQPTCFSLVPQSLFDASNAPYYLSLIHEKLEDSFVSYETLEFADIELVYALPKNLIQKTQKQFENVHLQSRQKALLEWICKESKSIDKQSLWAIFEENEMSLALFKKGRLLFFNTFQTKSWQDQLYYCMAICEQQDIDKNQIVINVLGRKVDPELNRNLKAQFPNFESYPQLSDASSNNTSIQLESTYLCA